LLSDTKLALEGLLELVEGGSSRPTPPKRVWTRAVPDKPNAPLTSNELYEALSEIRPDGAIVVEESPSNFMEFRNWWPALEPGSYYTYASGALGHNAPSSVGVALAQQKLGTGRPVVVLIGDGSLQYSVQSLASAAQHKLKMIYIVPCNGEYAILKEFAVLEKTPNVPALDLPFLDIVSLAKGYGCAATKAETKEEIQAAFNAALAAEGPTVITIPIKRELKPLIPLSSAK
jgi:benzoylformate decarboxylase